MKPAKPPMRVATVRPGDGALWVIDIDNWAPLSLTGLASMAAHFRAGPRRQYQNAVLAMEALSAVVPGVWFVPHPGPVAADHFHAMVPA